MSSAITLDARLDYHALPELVAKLGTAGDEPLVIDAAGVTHIGALALQVLLSAIRTRAAADLDTALINLPDAGVEQLALFGFTPETLTQPETWT